jgi:uncharacterized protein (TIGR03437 family)
MNTKYPSKTNHIRMAPASVIAIAALLAPALCPAQGRSITAKASSPSISSGGVVSASAFGGFTSVAPGSWIEIYGSNLATDTRSWASSDFNGVNAPTSLDGTSVTIGGQSAFVDYISPGQVNAEVPSSVAAGAQPVIVTQGGVASNPLTVTVNAEAPGLLAPSSFDIGGTQYVAALFSDGVTYVLPPGAIAGVPSRRAQPGDNITLYGVGFGPVIPGIPAGQIVQQDNSLALPFQLNFGQAQAAVTYDGLAPSAVGLYQFNVTVPNVASSDTVPATFTLGGVAGTQTLYIAIQSGNTAAQVQNLTLSATSVAGGGTVQGTVVLSEPAPSGGAVVALSSNSSAAIVPATVTVPANTTSATFTVSTGTVSSNQAVTITAAYSGSSAQAELTVTQSTATLPQFNVIDILVQGSQLGIETFAVVGPPAAGVYNFGELVGAFSNATGTVTYHALWNSVTVVGQTLTFTGLQGNSLSYMGVNGEVADITSGSVIVTLTPQVVTTSGTVTGTVNLVSTLGTVSGSFTGTYTAQTSQ